VFLAGATGLTWISIGQFECQTRGGEPFETERMNETHGFAMIGIPNSAPMESGKFENFHSGKVQKSSHNCPKRHS